MQTFAARTRKSLKALLRGMGIGQEDLEGLMRRFRRDPWSDRKDFTAHVDGVETMFAADDSYSHSWFYPRYGGGLIHEPVVTAMIVDAVRHCRCFFDIGANLGWFSCIAAGHMKSGTVHAFEMDDINFGLLQRNAELNGRTNIHAINAAVADSAGTVSYVKRSSRASAFFQLQAAGRTAGGRNTVTVPAMTVDQYVRQTGVTPEVLKIDVEGAEMRVLQGMTELLRNHHPVMFLEIHPGFLKQQESSASEVLKFLADHGYTACQIEGMRDIAEATRMTPLTPESEITTNDMLLCRPAAVAANQKRAA